MGAGVGKIVGNGSVIIHSFDTSHLLNDIKNQVFRTSAPPELPQPEPSPEELAEVPTPLLDLDGGVCVKLQVRDKDGTKGINLYRKDLHSLPRELFNHTLASEVQWLNIACNHFVYHKSGFYKNITKVVKVYEIDSVTSSECSASQASNDDAPLGREDIHSQSSSKNTQSQVSSRNSNSHTLKLVSHLVDKNSLVSDEDNYLYDDADKGVNSDGSKKASNSDVLDSDSHSVAPGDHNEDAPNTVSPFHAFDNDAHSHVVNVNENSDDTNFDVQTAEKAFDNDQIKVNGSVRLSTAISCDQISNKSRDEQQFVEGEKIESVNKSPKLPHDDKVDVERCVKSAEIIDNVCPDYNESALVSNNSRISDILVIDVSDNETAQEEENSEEVESVAMVTENISTVVADEIVKEESMDITKDDKDVINVEDIDSITNCSIENPENVISESDKNSTEVVPNINEPSNNAKAGDDNDNCSANSTASSSSDNSSRSAAVLRDDSDAEYSDDVTLMSDEEGDIYDDEGNKLVRGINTLPNRFDKFPNLLELNVGYYGKGNPLLVIPPSLFQLNSLQKLDASSCKLTDLPPEICQLVNLEELWLTGNFLTSLPRSLGDMKKLRSLWVNCNNLDGVPAALEHCDNLEGLYAHGNNIEFLSTALCRIPRLKYLGMSRNKIKFLPKNFGDLQCLVEAWLNDNQIREIPLSLFRIESLKILWLTNNQLSVLNDEVGQLRNLAELALSKNRLTSLPNSLSNCGKLRVLALEENKLLTLPKSLNRLMYLEELWLNGNFIKEMPEGLYLISSLKRAV